MKLSKHYQPKTNRGYSIVEMVVAVAIIGVLSMVAAPRYRTALERARASQAIYFLAQVQTAQEMYYAYAGEYSQSVRDLDGISTLPVGFQVKKYRSSDWQRNWRLVLEREGASNGFGNYRIAWTEKGFDWSYSSISEALLPYRVNRASQKRAKEQGFNLR
jgi:prepilin-type N-terminal cleavage/methylation domain-containing protein